MTPQKSVCFGWKGFRTGVRLESRTVRNGEEPEEHKCVYIRPFTPRIWRTTTQTDAILEVPGTAPIIEFFLQLVVVEWILVVFIRIQRKSINEDACKDS